MSWAISKLVPKSWKNPSKLLKPTWNKLLLSKLNSSVLWILCDLCVVIIHVLLVRVYNTGHTKLLYICLLTWLFSLFSFREADLRAEQLSKKAVKIEQEIATWDKKNAELEAKYQAAKSEMDELEGQMDGM